MEPVIIAVGSNLGDRLSYIQKAGTFLDDLSEDETHKSSIWDSEPVGDTKYNFLNCVAKIYTSLSPKELLRSLKDFEQSTGREKYPVRWGPRVIDLDLIAYGDLVIQQEGLIIPHDEYTDRLFVLLPLAELEEDWRDPTTKTHIRSLIEHASQIEIKKTEYDW